MKRLIPGTADVYISDTCEFSYYDGGVHQDVTVDDKNQATLRINGRTQTADVRFLMLLAFFEIPPYVGINNVRFIEVNIKKKHFPYRAIFLTPICIGEKRELRVVPSFSQVAVTADGRVYSLVKHRWLPQYIGKTGYTYASVYDPLIQTWRDVGIHQLVAMAWISKDQNSFNTVVNHKNGNRTDNRVQNLEWCTQTYNTIDGIIRQRYKSEVKVRLRDVFTKEIHEFKTYSDAGKFLGLVAHQRTQFEPLRRNRLLKNRYEVRLSGDTRPWFYEDENVVNYSAAKYVIAVVEDTGRRFLFNGCKAFKEFYGLGAAKLGVNDLIAAFKSKFPEFEVFYTNLSETLPIEVRVEPVGTVTIYKNKAEVARLLKIEHRMISILVASNGTLSHNGYRMRTFKDSADPWPEVFQTKKAVDRQHIRVTHVPTGKVSYFVTIDKVSEKLGLARPTVRRIISSPADSDEYKIEYFKPLTSSTQKVESSHELLENPKD